MTTPSLAALSAANMKAAQPAETAPAPVAQAERPAPPSFKAAPDEDVVVHAVDDLRQRQRAWIDRRGRRDDEKPKQRREEKPAAEQASAAPAGDQNAFYQGPFSLPTIKPFIPAEIFSGVDIMNFDRQSGVINFLSGASYREDKGRLSYSAGQSKEVDLAAFSIMLANAKANGWNRIDIFGANRTMAAEFYGFARAAGFVVVVPEETEELRAIMEKYAAHDFSWLARIGTAVAIAPSAAPTPTPAPAPAAEQPAVRTEQSPEPPAQPAPAEKVAVADDKADIASIAAGQLARQEPEAAATTPVAIKQPPLRMRGFDEQRFVRGVEQQFGVERKPPTYWDTPGADSPSPSMKP
jgi:Pyruvate/2-oxoglutarate dehydrogenase complex, dihydrolipoamide acyltransferase (E2) component, and related enzymes